MCVGVGISRFVCISDTHTRTGQLKLPPGDVLVHAGDFTNIGAPKDIDGFVDFLSDQDFKYKVSKCRLSSHPKQRTSATDMDSIPLD